MARSAKPAESPAARAPFLARLGPALAVAAAAFAVYAGTLGSALVWDDTGLRTYVEGLVRGGGLAKLLSAEFVVDSMANASLGYYRPVVLASLWVDGRFAGASGFPYHLTNVLLHVAVTLLVFVLLRALFRSARAALIGAMFFALHPVHTESVAFVAGRTDLWAALFVLPAASLWVRGREDRGWGAPALSALCLLAAGLSKEVSFVLPPVLLAWDAAGLGGAEHSRWLARNGRWILAWAAALVVVALLRADVAHVHLGASGDGAGGWTNILADPLRSLARVCLYLRLLVIPWPLNASYGAHEVTLTALTALGALLWLALSLAAIRLDRRRGVAGVLWTLGFLVPVSGFLAYAGSDVAERFLYLPSVGTAILVAQLEAGFRSSRLRALTGVAAAVLGVTFAGATIARARVWRDDLTLYEDIARTSTSRPLAHSNLGLEYLKAKRYGEAVDELQRALQLNPGFVLARTNLGLAYRALGRRDEALAAFQEAARESPAHPGILGNLGDEYRETNRFAEAAAVYERVEAIAPNAPDVHFKLGLTYGALRRFVDAEQEFATTIRLVPQAAEPHFRRGLVLAAAGNVSDAQQEERTLERMRSAYAPQLAQALAQAASPSPHP